MLKAQMFVDNRVHFEQLEADVARLERAIDAHYTARVASMVTAARQSQKQSITVDRIALLYLFADLEHAADGAPAPWETLAEADEPPKIRALRRRLTVARARLAARE